MVLQTKESREIKLQEILPVLCFPCDMRNSDGIAQNWGKKCYVSLNFTTILHSTGKKALHSTLFGQQWAKKKSPIYQKHINKISIFAIKIRAGLFADNRRWYAQVPSAFGG